MRLMPSRSCLDYLSDIRDNALLAQKWTAGQTPETFIGNQQLFYAVTRCLEIISEASRRLPEETRERHPQLPWRAIADAGNVYRHAYDNVAEEAVWRTVQHSLPALLAVAEGEIAALSALAPDQAVPMAEIGKPPPGPEKP